MLIKEENFRNLYKSYVIIKDRTLARQIARTMEIDSVWEDDQSSEELQEKLSSIEIDDSINAIFAFAYIDHTAGISFRTLALACLDGERAEIVRRENFDSLITFRKGDVNDSEFEYLEDIEVNDDFDIRDHEFLSKTTDSYFVNERVEALRFIDVLDPSRNEDYPDDVSVLFIKEGCQIEKMWVRYEDIIGGAVIEATLLNNPFQDFGVKAGDRVKIFPYLPEEGEEYVLICDLNEK